MNPGKVFPMCILFTCVYLMVENIPSAVGTPYSGKGDNSFSASHEDEIETGDIAVVRLLTRPRSRRDLSKNDYHILEVDIPSRKTNLKVHIVKTDAITSPNLQTFVISENGTRELLSENENSHSNCLYTGTISGESEKSVALSACNSDTPGFTGMIKYGDEHLFIQPKMSTSAENRNTNETKATREILHVVHTGNATSGVGYSDAVYVPKSELEEAVALMAKQLEKYKQNSDSDAENEEKNTLIQTMEFNGNSENSVDNGINIETLAAKSGSSCKTVELAIFCDAKLYRAYQKKFPKDTVKQMKSFSLTLVNCMDLIYKEKSLGVNICFRLVVLEVMKSDPSNLGATEDADSYLRSFCRYSAGINTDGESWDHALILTGLDISGDGNPYVTGVAYAGTMCIQYYSCSLSEAKSFGCVYTISHELGHSLGMDHDGSKASRSCNSEKYIMSPTTGPGKTQWSTCSSENLKEFIKTGNNIVGSSSSLPTCLSKTSKKSKSISFASKKLPGEKYDAKAQCAMEFGKDYTPYTSGKYADVCYMLYCGRQESSTRMLIGPTHPALEGTSCGSGKVRMLSIYFKVRNESSNAIST